MVPKPIVLVDPVTGSEAPGYASGSGISPVPASYFDGYLDAPRFRRGQANLTTIESLIEHVNRFKDSQSVLFAVDDRKQIGRAHVCTPVTNAHLVCRLLL